MPNWNHIVRQHLAALRLSPERKIEIVGERGRLFEAAPALALRQKWEAGWRRTLPLTS